MIDLEQTVVKKWGKRNKNRYEQLGYVFTKYGDEFKVKVKDIPEESTDIVNVKCDFCGKPLNVKYNRYLEAIEKYGNYSCQHCHQSRTLEKRQNEMYNEILEFCKKYNYTLVTNKEEILSRETYVTYICPEHGSYTTKVTSILQGKICYPCSRHNAGINRWKHGMSERIAMYYQMAIKKCDELGYELLSKEDEIISYDTYVRYKCPIHGEHEMKFGNLMIGRHCPDCSNPKSLKIKDTNEHNKTASNKLSMEEIIRRVEKCGGMLLNPEDYKNTSERNLVILCPRCGRPFTTSLVLFTQHGGQVCKECYRRESVGERRIRKYLEQNKYVFSPEYWFLDCRDIKPLPFDFYLNDLNILIEFDGKQHFYDSKKFFSNNYDYETLRKHDKIKSEYCKNNNIKLIRIPYWDIDEIDKILDIKLKE